MDEGAITILLLGVIATAGAGLVGKIIYNWLKHGRASCPECSRLSTKVSDLEACMIQEKMTIKTLQKELSDHEKQLDRVNKTMDKILSEIGDVKTNIGILIERSKRRREEYG